VRLRIEMMHVFAFMAGAGGPLCVFEGLLFGHDVIAGPVLYIYIGLSLLSMLVLAFLLPYLATLRRGRPFWIFGALYGLPLLGFALVGDVDIPLTFGGFGAAFATLGVLGGYWGQRRAAALGDHPNPTDSSVPLSLGLGLLAVPNVAPAPYVAVLAIIASREARKGLREGRLPASERLFVAIALGASYFALACFGGYIILSALE
jgi:hypothetical protein